MGTRSLGKPCNFVSGTQARRYHAISQTSSPRFGCGRLSIYNHMCRVAILAYAKPGYGSQQDLFIHSHPVQPITANLRSALAKVPSNRLLRTHTRTPPVCNYRWLLPLQTFFNRPSRCASRFRESSLSPIARTNPHRA